jgi:hypothetical protein
MSQRVWPGRASGNKLHHRPSPGDFRLGYHGANEGGRSGNEPVRYNRHGKGIQGNVAAAAPHWGATLLPPTMSEAEIRSLVAYLEQLAAIPGAEKNQIAVKESSYRIGEHIVKSTCHVCHSATGPNPSPEQILKGAIPPLSALTTRVSLSGFVRKVTSGAPIIMGTPPTYYRGKMPVFVYLSQDEAAAAYLYLIRYRPRP